eukprot:Em0010g979a
MNVHPRSQRGVDTPERTGQVSGIFTVRLMILIIAAWSCYAKKAYWRCLYQCIYGTPPAVHSRTTWFPGEVIECGNTGTSRRNEMEELKGWMHQLVADMQTSILGRISDIEQNIQSLSDRVSSLERQSEAVDVLQQADETATAAMPHQSPRHTRTRKAPTEIQASGVRISLQCLFLPYQGRIREVYNNLGEELHFRLDEGIDSEFNKKIVSLVAAEFDKDHCPIATVKAGLVTYKRTLKRALTSNDSTSRRVKRSRQQRLWEKRCQVLKDDEKQLWGDIKPKMMSEEESDDQNAQLYNVAVRRGVLIG